MKKRKFGSGGTPSPRKSGENAKGSKAVKKYAVGGNTKGIMAAAVNRAQNFDRNTALRDFNTQARRLLAQGVPKAEIIKQQGVLRRLQMDNSSTPAQHRAALSSALGMGRATLQPGSKIGSKLFSGAPSSGAPMLGRHGGSTGPARGGLSSLPGLDSSFSGALASLRPGAPSSGAPMLGRHGGPSGPTSSGMSSGSGAPMIQPSGPTTPPMQTQGMSAGNAMRAALAKPSTPPIAGPLGPRPPAAGPLGMKKGGKVKAQPVKKMAKGGSTASKRGDGCATKGKTKGRFV